VIILVKDISEVIETPKALGIPIKHKGQTKIMWLPKSLIENNRDWKRKKIIDVPDWIYDKKIDECFLNGENV